MEESSDSHPRQSSASFNLVCPALPMTIWSGITAIQRLVFRLNAVKRL
jgi:hypothetical protein